MKRIHQQLDEQNKIMLKSEYGEEDWARAACEEYDSLHAQCSPAEWVEWCAVQGFEPVHDGADTWG